MVWVEVFREGKMFLLLEYKSYIKYIKNILFLCSMFFGLCACVFNNKCLNCTEPTKSDCAVGPEDLQFNCKSDSNLDNESKEDFDFKDRSSFEGPSNDNVLTNIEGLFKNLGNADGGAGFSEMQDFFSKWNI